MQGRTPEEGEDEEEEEEEEGEGSGSDDSAILLSPAEPRKPEGLITPTFLPTHTTSLLGRGYWGGEGSEHRRCYSSTDLLKSPAQVRMCVACVEVSGARSSSLSSCWCLPSFPSFSSFHSLLSFRYTTVSSYHVQSPHRTLPPSLPPSLPSDAASDADSAAATKMTCPSRSSPPDPPPLPGAPLSSCSDMVFVFGGRGEGMEVG